MRVNRFVPILSHSMIPTLLMGASLVLSASLTSTTANAAIYKCVDDTGAVTYSGIACPVKESAQKITASAVAVDELDCRVARQLAVDTVTRMRSGVSAESVYNNHGGLDNLSPFVVSLIDYVYTFDGDQTIEPTRVITLTTDRCKIGAFGSNSTRCELYPYDFLQVLGGCSIAFEKTRQRIKLANAYTGSSAPPADPLVGASLNQQPNQASQALPSVASAVYPTQQNPEFYSLPPLAAAKPTVTNSTSDSNTAPHSADAHAECQERLEEQLETTSTQMRNAQDIHVQDRLRRRHRHLRAQLTRC